MSNENGAVVGVIGGSGLYEMDGLTEVREEALATPFGEPSDAYVLGRLDDVQMVFLPRHGRGHRISPSELNTRANIWGMKRLGVTHIVSISAVGSMREDIVPGQFVAIDQFFDRTRHRPDTFFSDGIVAHVHFADPVCNDVRQALIAACGDVGVHVHDGGTYLNMEGPQFSTRAESKIYRQWGVDVIGMTNLQEAKLAREAELAYSTVALVTDYDCWHEVEGDVDVAAVLAVLKANADLAQRTVVELAKAVGALDEPISAAGCMEHAVMTAPERITPDARRRLELLIGKYLG